MNNLKATTLSFVVSLLLLFGCSKAPTNQQEETADGLVATTDKLVYELSKGYIQVQFAIENTSESTAWFFHCGESFINIVNRFENNNWEDKGGWGWPCLAIFSQGINPLIPDSTYIGSHRFKQAGDYRFSFLYSWDNNINTWSDTLYSNEFTIQ